jgi:hypothetical protein
MKRIDICGQRFGKLVVLGHRPQDVFSRWLCKCDCGVEKLVEGRCLRTGATKSCGCLKTARRFKLAYEWIFNRLRKSAKERGIPCDLLYEEFLELIERSTCHYCGTPVRWQAHALGGGKTSCYQLDRKDSTLGYTKINLVVCCARCNRAKGNNFTYQEWLEIGKVIEGFGTNA